MDLNDGQDLIIMTIMIIIRLLLCELQLVH